MKIAQIENTIDIASEMTNIIKASFLARIAVPLFGPWSFL